MLPIGTIVKLSDPSEGMSDLRIKICEYVQPSSFVGEIIQHNHQLNHLIGRRPLYIINSLYNGWFTVVNEKPLTKKDCM